MNDFTSGIVQGLLGGVADYGQSYLQRKQQQEQLAYKQQLEDEKQRQKQQEEDKTWGEISKEIRESFFEKKFDEGTLGGLLTDPRILRNPGARDTVNRIYNEFTESQRRRLKEQEEQDKLNRGKNIYSALTNKGVDIPSLDDMGQGQTDPDYWKTSFKEFSGQDPEAFGFKTKEEAQAAIDQQFPGRKRSFSQEEIVKLRGELATTSPALLSELDRQIKDFESPQYETGLYDPKTDTIYDQEYKTDYWTGKKVVTKPRMNAREREKKNDFGQTTVTGATKSVFDKDFKDYFEAKSTYDAAIQNGMVWDSRYGGTWVKAGEDGYNNLVAYWEGKKKNEYAKAMSNLTTMMSPAARDYIQGMPAEAKDDMQTAAASIMQAYKDGEIKENDFQYLTYWFRLYHKTEIANVR